MIFTHLVFPHFSRLTVRIEHFRLENRIPDAQLYHFPAGMVWNHEVESKHLKLVFLLCFVLPYYFLIYIYIYTRTLYMQHEESDFPLENAQF